MTSNFCPLGLSAPDICGYIRLLNHEKMCIKPEVEEILFKLAANDRSDKMMFLITKKFTDIKISSPKGFVNFCPRAMFKLLNLINH